MFARDDRDSNDRGQARRQELVGGREERRVAAWIGASIVIDGNLTSSEDKTIAVGVGASTGDKQDTTIAGRVEGDVAVREHTLVVAPGGRIHGDIVARIVAVHGEVAGSINATGKLEIGATGSVEGDIVTPRLVVMEGATLTGNVGVGLPSPQPV